MVQSFTSRGASHCDHETFSFKPRDKNLAADSSNSQQRFYHSSDFDSNVDCVDLMSVSNSGAYGPGSPRVPVTLPTLGMKK